MKTASLWIVRAALAVQLVCVLAVPVAYAADDQPRAMWMAEWVRPDTPERAIGVLRLRDGKLTFVEQLGRVDWDVDLSDIKRVTTVNKSLSITVGNGTEYVVSVMEPNLTQASPKKVSAMLERALQILASAGR